MANKEKTQIRLNKVRQRLKKVIYPKCPHSKNVIKALERIKILSKYSDDIWAAMYQRGFRPSVDNGNEAYFADFEILGKNSKKIESLTRSIDRNCKKSGKTEDEIVHIHQEQNRRMTTSF